VPIRSSNGFVYLPSLPGLKPRPTEAEGARAESHKKFGSTGPLLYADMGHFGKHPIRLTWFSLVLPSLVLNYLGQGALLLEEPTVEHPFFELAPSWALLPLVALSTAAAIIASQALISGAFSITRQAIQLGLAPRLDVEHTSAREMGQIIVTRRKGMAIWRERLFVLMARNAVRAKAFFRLPPERVVELGVQVEM